ncbi:MAG: SMR family transporter [Patescibacteria group bacterium]
MDWFLNIFSKFPVWTLLCFAAISVVTGDVLAKYWSTNTKPVFYFAALTAYAFSGFFYIPTLLREGLVVTSIIWSILSIVGFLVVGILIFKETLTPLQIVGIILGIIALIILKLGE